MASFTALKALAVFGCDLRRFALLRGVALLEAVGARDVALVTWRSDSLALRRSSSERRPLPLLDLLPHKGTELLVRHGLHGIQLVVARGAQELLPVPVEEVGLCSSGSSSVRLREPLRAVLDPLPEDVRLAVKLVELPQRLISDLDGDEPHNGSHLAMF